MVKCDKVEVEKFPSSDFLSESSFIKGIAN